MLRPLVQNDFYCQSYLSRERIKLARDTYTECDLNVVSRAVGLVN